MTVESQGTRRRKKVSIDVENVTKISELLTHQSFLKLVMLELSKINLVSYQIATGTFKSMDGKRIVKCGLNGHSDLIAIGKRVFFIEIKIKRDRQSADQKLFQTMVESRGQPYYIIRPENIKEVLNEIHARNNNSNISDKKD